MKINNKKANINTLYNILNKFIILYLINKLKNLK